VALNLGAKWRTGLSHPIALQFLREISGWHGGRVAAAATVLRGRTD